MTTAPVNAKFDTTLDDSERYIRDRLGVNLDGWARFRREINCGTSLQHLSWSSPETDEKKDCYLDLGKSLYEVVCSLGFAKWSLEEIQTSRVTLLHDGEVNPADYLPFLKNSKEFYYHLGCIADNLARLIFIINHSNPDTQLTGGKHPVLARRHVSWGNMKSNTYENFSTHRTSIDDNVFNEALLIRHFLTHCWGPPKKVDRNGAIFWPIEIRSERVFEWPHDDHETAKRLTYTPIIPMMEKDFLSAESIQNAVFTQLTSEVSAFESRMGFSTSKITGHLLSCPE